MSSISKPNTFTSNTTISSSAVNANFDTIYNDYNGGISAANLASNAVTTAKIADSNVTTAKIADGAVTYAKTDGDIWWEEIGRTTLGSNADTITVSSLPARKYLRIVILTLDTGGTINPSLIFNNDSGSTYAINRANNFTSQTTGTNLPNISFMSTAGAFPVFLTGDILNLANEDKTVMLTSVEHGATGAGTAPISRFTWGKWGNTSAQINRIDITNAGTGDFAIGSEIIVLGHN